VTKKLVLVDAISQFRIRYAVEVDEVDLAKDVVVREVDNPDFQEFSQLHLGELVSSYREITREEYLGLFDEDNSHMRSWPDEEKFGLINYVGDEQ
jgi:hypothetical protein